MLSIVVPVFNGMPFLPGLFDRLNSQTFQCFEVIFVDDGSTDGSGEFIEEHLIEGKYFCYRQKKQGAGAARNLGLKYTRGDYIWFLDCDDIISENFVQKMYIAAKTTKSDIAVCSCQNYDTKLEEVVENTYSIRKDLIPYNVPCCVSPDDIRRDFFHSFVWWPWDKIFKKSLLTDNQLWFDHLSSTNDLHFVCIAMILSKKITILDDVLITHRVNIRNSVSNVRHRSPTNCLSALENVLNDLHKYGIWESRKIDFINYFLAFIHWHLVTLPKAGRLLLFYKAHKFYMKLMKKMDDEIEFYYPGLNCVSQVLRFPSPNDYLQIYKGHSLILNELKDLGEG